MITFCFLLFACQVACKEFTLEARNIESNDKISLGTFDYDSKSHTVSTIALRTNKVSSNQAYCLDAKFDNGEMEFSCFQYTELSFPLQYNLVLDLHGDELEKLSLTFNPAYDGILPVIRAPVKGPSPSAIKLKKVTKTYKDKKAGTKALTAQFEEDVEVENKSWIQKSWKKIVLGAVIYSAVSSFGSGAKKQPQQKTD